MNNNNPQNQFINQQLPNQGQYQSPQQPPKKKKMKKWQIALIVVGIIIAIGVIGGNANKSSNSTDDTKITSSTEETTTTNDKEQVKSETGKKPESQYESVNYIELYNDSDSYKNKYVKICGKISTVDKNITGTVYITIEDGLEEGITNEVYCNFLDSEAEVETKYKEGDYVEIAGKVGNKIIGTLNIDDCYIVSSGDKAKEKINEYEQQKEIEIANKRETFIADCVTYAYKEISRNPRDYKGKKAKFSGEVIQIMESGNDVTLRVNVTKQENEFVENGYLYSDTVYVEYTRKSESESRILDGDIIDIYGTLNGTKTYDNVLGSETTIPYLQAEYIVIETE